MNSKIARKLIVALVSGAALLQASGCDFIQDCFWTGYDIGYNLL